MVGQRALQWWTWRSYSRWCCRLHLKRKGLHWGPLLIFLPVINNIEKQITTITPLDYGNSKMSNWLLKEVVRQPPTIVAEMGGVVISLKWMDQRIVSLGLLMKHLKPTVSFKRVVGLLKLSLPKSIFTVTLSLESRRMQNPCQFLTLDNEDVFNILIHVYSWKTICPQSCLF